MSITTLFLLAAIMAVFGVFGYLKGVRWAVAALLLLLVIFIMVEKRSATIASTINGLYLGVMLTLKGGLGAIASGDLESAGALLESTARPVTDANRQMVMLLVVLAVVGVAMLLSLVWKSKSSPLGLLFGLAYGYILSATMLPLLLPGTGGRLPVPFLRAAAAPTAAAAAADTDAADSLFNRLVSSLGNPQSIQMLGWLLGLIIVLILLFSVRNSAKSGSKKKG